MLTRRSLLMAAASTGTHLSLPRTAWAQTGTPAWSFLQPGDVIDVVAPSSPVDAPAQRAQTIRNYFRNTPFRVNIPVDLIEPTTPLDEANTIEKRAQFMHEALSSDSKAIWALGGGGWGADILDALKQYPRPTRVKPILGYSDITALHVFANAYLGFPSIHSVVLGINGDISPGWNLNGIGTALDVLSGKTPELVYNFTPLNQAARRMGTVNTKIVGGNALLLSALKGTTHYALDTRGKFLFIESVANNPGEFDRVLTGFAYSSMVSQSMGVLFGDIIQTGGQPNPVDIQTQFDTIVQRFADRFAHDKIVLQAENLFGHGPVNMPLPLNTCCSLTPMGQSVLARISANLV